MKKVFKLCIFLLVIILCGCSKEVSDNIETEKVVKDNDIIWRLTNQIKGLESLDTTYNLYKLGNGSITNYTNEDKILYGINMSIRDDKIDNDTILISDIKSYINNNFGPTNISFKTINNYTYDNNKYIISYINKDKKIVSYIDKITTKYNYYYVNVYVGIKDKDQVYGDLDENKLVQVLYEDTQYEIDTNDKELFTKYRYKFEKNYEGKYILVDFRKI